MFPRDAASHPYLIKKSPLSIPILQQRLGPAQIPLLSPHVLRSGKLFLPSDVDLPAPLSARPPGSQNVVTAPPGPLTVDTQGTMVGGRHIDFCTPSHIGHQAAQYILSPRAPTAKEIRDARAAAIRLGFIEADALDPGTPRPPALPSGPEPTTQTVRYTSKGELTAFADDATALDALSSVLTAATCFDPAAWVDACDVLLRVRRLVVFHDELLPTHTPTLLQKIVFPSIKSSRSAVSKSSMLAFNDVMGLAWEGRQLRNVALDEGGLATPGTSFVHQFLLKAAGKDRFLMQEAIQSLLCVAAAIPLAYFIDMLVPYGRDHRNPRIRAKAAKVVAAAVACAGPEAVGACNLVELVVFAADILSDREQESRDAARSVLRAVHGLCGTPDVWEELTRDLSPLVAPKIANVVGPHQST